jgi:hypothetical protein
MLRVQQSLVRSALVAAGALWLAGCSSLPSAPGSNTFRNPDFVHVASSPSGTMSASAVLDTSSATGQVAIDGAVGGTLQVGRFTLTFPPGAFGGTATVSILVPNQSVVHCRLNISPASANGFAVPVILRSDCTGTLVPDPSRLTELWFDEAAGVWRQVPGSTPDIVNTDVIAPLRHFSDYGVIDFVEGKAGW